MQIGRQRRTKNDVKGAFSVELLVIDSLETLLFNTIELAPIFF